MPEFKKIDPIIDAQEQFLKKQKSYKKYPKKIIRDIQKKSSTKGSIKNLTPNITKDISDGWSNIITGLNQRYDKSRYTTFSGCTVLDDTMLAQMWIGDGFSKKIVSARPDDMTRQWITIENDPDKLILHELKRLDVKQNINLALKWRSLFGGGINVLGINDGGKLEEPVNINRIKSIDWIKTYDRTDCYITEFHFNKNIESENQGELEYITIQPLYSSPFNVHVSRCLIWKGIPVPQRISSYDMFYFWGMGELQAGWNELKNLCASMNHIVKIIYEFIIGKYKIDGLKQLIAENNRSQVEDIIAIIEMAKSTIQGVMLDSADDYTRDSANVSGLSDLLDRYMMMLAGVYDYPVTRLFGRSPAGENATGDGDRINYYDTVKAAQENIMEKNLMKLIDYINISLGNKIKEPAVIFNPLLQLSQKEELDCKKIQADMDKIYIDSGVLTADEIAENRFGGEGYSYDTKIDFLNRESEMQMENEDLKNQLEELRKQQALQNISEKNPEEEI